MIPKIKVLIADDSALMRKVLREILSSDSRIDVVGAARDGIDLLEKVQELEPHVITLDINMPRMDGITALKKLVKKGAGPVIMVSSLTQQGAETTLQALEEGAFDCIAKPDGTVSADMSSVSRELIRKVKAASRSGVMDKLSTKGKHFQKTVSSIPKLRTRVERPQRLNKDKSPKIPIPYTALTIGISTGGPKTIFDFLPLLPADLNAAIFLVQHLPPKFTSSFATRVDKACKMRCVEAESGTIVEPGTIYLGKGSFQLCVVQRRTGEVYIRTPSRPEHIFKPSVDIMMQSVLDVYGPQTVGVLMTGMGDDGAEGLCQIDKAGGVTIVESEESAVVWGMPGAAVAKGGAQIEAHSWEMARVVTKIINSH